MLAALPVVDAPAQHVFEVRADTWQSDVDALVPAITLNAIAASEGTLLVHAGAVAAPTGDVVVICGRSGSGKSTLTARLARSGLAYLTDETVRLDPVSLRVTPFRRPISIKPGSHDAVWHLRPTDHEPVDGIWWVPPAALGDTPLPSQPLLPRLLIFPVFDRAATACDVEPITPGQAGFLLGEQSSRLRLVRGGPLPALARLVRRAPGYKLRYSDGEQATAEVQNLLLAA